MQRLVLETGTYASGDVGVEIIIARAEGGADALGTIAEEEQVEPSGCVPVAEAFGDKLKRKAEYESDIGIAKEVVVTHTVFVVIIDAEAEGDGD